MCQFRSPLGPLVFLLLLSCLLLPRDCILLAQEASTKEESVSSTPADAKPTETKPETAKEASQGNETPQGHSYHGEAFNEGPRSAAYLMSGMANISFPVTTSSEKAQAFVNQGVSQLHGFWYYEAERSFRQAAMLDPKCGIAYWGMAMANVENMKRAREFIKQANEHKAAASRREQMYISAYEKFCRDKDDNGKEITKKSRAQSYTSALEEIVLEFPEDIEAKALLAGQLWANERSDLPIVGHVAINSLLQQIFDINSMHPAHHYRIHLWDNKKAEQALKSAAMCGPSSPGIAHMWHMPGHTYSKVNRYHDAVWQQEASARVDHAHMMRDHVMPDQIHNFAHNNEWLIRNLIKIGRVSDAISLAKNMIELPRHPKYNSLNKNGSAKYGRERLFQTLYAYQLWQDLLELSTSAYLPDDPDDEDWHLQWSRYVGIAQALGRSPEAAQPVVDELTARLEKGRLQLEELSADEKKLSEPPAKPTTDESKSAKADVDTAELQNSAQQQANAETPANNSSDVSTTTTANSDGRPEKSTNKTECAADDSKNKKELAEKKKSIADKRKKIEESQKKIEKSLHSVQAVIASCQKRYFQAIELAAKGDDLDSFVVDWQLSSGNYDKAIELAKKKVSSSKNEILPLALQAIIEFQHAGPDAARETFEKLRDLATMAEIQTPPLARLRWLAESLGHAADWRKPYEQAGDVGARPDLDSLGPYRWSPYALPDLAVQDLQGQQLQINGIQRPTLVVFYLGFGCLHCVEQLKALTPRLEQFRDQGIDILAVSTETFDQIQTAKANYDGKLEIPLHITTDMAAFKTMRCYDDFEKQPLHGLFLIAPGKDGRPARVCWQDISFEPFMDIDFIAAESHRLLKLTN